MTATVRAASREILVAGIGNIFLGDDGFGVEVARRLGRRALPAGVAVRDFGIRGFDLAFAMRDYDVVVFVDTVPVQDGPGTLHLIDASEEAAVPVAAETHGMHPAAVLAFAKATGPMPERVLVLGCEPAVLPDPRGVEIVRGLSPPVLAVVDEAVEQLEALVQRLVEGTYGPMERPTERPTHGATIEGARDGGQAESAGRRASR